MQQDRLSIIPFPSQRTEAERLIKKYAECKRINRRTERAAAFIHWQAEMQSYIDRYNL